MHVLVNWLAQGCIIAVAAAATLRLLPVSRTQARYCLVWVATLLVVAVPVLSSVIAAMTAQPSGTNRLVEFPSPAALPLLTMPDTWWTSTTVALALWLTWAMAYTARVALDTSAIRRARREAAECPVAVLARVPRWSSLKNSGRSARIIVSSHVRTAAILGCGSPLIALSPTLADELSDEDLERVIVHEWAHVQRRDDISAALQAFLHIVAGWHPAVRWLHRRIEIEREVACDEIAVAVTGSAKAYAACLTVLAARPMALPHSLAALSAVSTSSLHQRIVRILAAQGSGSAGSRRGFAIAASGAMMVFAIAIVDLQIVESAGASTRTSVDARPIARSTPTVSRAASDDAIGLTRSAPPLLPARPAVALSNTATVTPIRDAVPPRTSGEAVASRALTSANELTGTPIAVAVLIPVPAPSLPGASRDGRLRVTVQPESPGATVTATPDVSAASWTGAVNAGIAIGRGSQNAGIATGRVFSRFGKRVAGSF